MPGSVLYCVQKNREVLTTSGKIIFPEICFDCVGKVLYKSHMNTATDKKDEAKRTVIDVMAIVTRDLSTVRSDLALDRIDRIAREALSGRLR